MTAFQGRGRPLKQRPPQWRSHYITYHGREYRVVFSTASHEKVLLVERRCKHTEVALKIDGPLGRKLVKLAREGVVAVEAVATKSLDQWVAENSGGMPEDRT